MEAMLGETGEGSREEAGSSCDTGGNCFNGEVNGDLEDTMEMCDMSQHNSLMIKVVSNKCLNDERSSITDSLPQVTRVDCGIGDRQEVCSTESQISDKVPNSEPANMCRDLASEVPTSVGKSIERIDIGKTVVNEEIKSVSTLSIKDSELSKEIVNLNKNCDDTISHGSCVQNDNTMGNEGKCFSDKDNVELSENSELKSRCNTSMTEKNIIIENSGDPSNERNSENCGLILSKNLEPLTNEIGCCDTEEAERENNSQIETNGRVEGDHVANDASAEAGNESKVDLELGREAIAQSKNSNVVAVNQGSLEQNNGETKSHDECHVSSSVLDDKDEKNEEQPQIQTENLEGKSEEVSSKVKKSRKSAVVLNLTPRRSSRNLNKQKSYVEKEEEPDIQEITPSDPLADPLSADPLRDDKENSKTRGARKNTIVVNDTKRLVEIATGSKGMKGGKKEPTLVIIDTNSILSGRGPVPVSQGSPPVPSSISSSSPSSSGYSVLPIALPAQGLYPPIRLNNPVPSASMHPPVPTPVQPRPPQPQILPTLTDDMYVVEAPSFIVPYVYEKPPIKPLREYLDQLELEIEETKIREKELAGDEEDKAAKIEEKELACDEEEKDTKISEKESAGDEEEKVTSDSLQENGNSENEDMKNQTDLCKESCEESEILDSKSKGNDDIELGEKNPDSNDSVTDNDDHSKTKCNAAEVKDDNCEKDSLGTDAEKCEESEKVVDFEKPVDEEKATDDEKCVSEKSIDGDNKGADGEKIVYPDSAVDDEKVGDGEKADDGDKTIETDKANDIEKGMETEKNVENRNSDSNGNSASIEGRDKNEMKLEETSKSSYFDNPLGKFFMQIGINLVQEYVQTDLLRSQKRKRDREGRKGTVSTQYAINSLVKNLEFSKENNEPFHLEQKKCEYCSFKTESSLVMAQHLETPHMRNYVYRCNFCPLEVRSPHDILFHMEAEHNVRGRLERAPAFHQCPNCPFEDSQKGKLTRHMLSCAKKHKPERNQEPPPDWEPPAKIPRLTRSRPTALGLGAAAYQAMAAKSVHPLLPKLVPGAVLPPAPGGLNRGRGRPPIHGRYVPQDPKATQRPIAPSQVRQNMIYRPGGSPSQPQVLLPTAYQIAGSQIYQVVGSQNQMPMVPSSVPSVPRLALMSPSTANVTVPTPVALVPNIATGNSSITIQSASKSPTAKLLQQPSISITPLPRQPAGMAPGNTMHPKHIGHSGHPGHSQNKATFVICEICDGYIKDLEQLRNHMQWIHKVKIHPKMIYNRPPLNCQKCQFRFFTDQGLERHLLGSHGLVTSSMQEAANKGKDGGRCPVCGRVYQWKLLNHVARDHNMSLKPAHLSYKCTVCTATFGMYKQFENHVYSAHSVVAKRVIDKKSPQVPRPQSSETLLKPLKINDEITIIPQPARPRPGPASRTGAVSAIMQQNMGPKRFKQRLQQKQSSVQVIELEDSPVKKDKATDGSGFQENGEDTLNAVKERLRRRKSLEISQVDSECSSQLSDDAPAKKRRRNDE